jgi:hypothetical protein
MSIEGALLTLVVFAAVLPRLLDDAKAQAEIRAKVFARRGFCRVFPL